MIKLTNDQWTALYYGSIGKLTRSAMGFWPDPMPNDEYILYAPSAIRLLFKAGLIDVNVPVPDVFKYRFNSKKLTMNGIRIDMSSLTNGKIQVWTNANGRNLLCHYYNNYSGMTKH